MIDRFGIFLVVVDMRAARRVAINERYVRCTYHIFLINKYNFFVDPRSHLRRHKMKRGYQLFIRCDNKNDHITKKRGGGSAIKKLSAFATASRFLLSAFSSTSSPRSIVFADAHDTIRSMIERFAFNFKTIEREAIRSSFVF